MPRPDSFKPREVWGLATVLFLVFFNFPLLQVFNSEKTVFGLPLLWAYLLGGWIICIVLIRLFVKRLEGQEAAEPPVGEGDGAP